MTEHPTPHNGRQAASPAAAPDALGHEESHGADPDPRDAVRRAPARRHQPGHGGPVTTRVPWRATRSRARDPARTPVPWAAPYRRCAPPGPERRPARPKGGRSGGDPARDAAHDTGGTPGIRSAAQDGNPSHDPAEDAAHEAVAGDGRGARPRSGTPDERPASGGRRGGARRGESRTRRQDTAKNEQPAQPEHGPRRANLCGTRTATPPWARHADPGRGMAAPSNNPRPRVPAAPVERERPGAAPRLVNTRHSPGTRRYRRQPAPGSGEAR